MKLPRLSILMPVFNCGPFLDEAIWSIRHQTFGDFECVIVNDGSTDDSLGIMRRHAAEDQRIIVIDRPNGGIVHALNAGLAKCRAPLIARMDGDDIAHLNRFEVQIAHMQEHPELGVLGTAVEVITEVGLPSGPEQFPLEHEAIDQAHLTRAGYGVCHPTTMMRTQLLREIGAYRDTYRYAEDLDLFLRLAEVTQLHNLPDVLLRYRRHPGAVSLSLRGWQTRSATGAVLDAMRRRGLKSTPGIHQIARCASWTAGDEGQIGQALKYGLIAWRYRPLSSTGPKVLARALMRAVRPA